MFKRTHNCGELDEKNAGAAVCLCGWVESRRDHGGVIFIDLRDRWGKTQVKFHPEMGKERFATAERLRLQSVIGVKGAVVKRLAGSENPKLKTGKIEVDGRELQILNESEPPPFDPSEYTDAGEEIRLKWRFLDLRRPGMQRNLILRSRTAMAVRRYFAERDFVEVETPFLTRSTPEGARDFLVPSRLNPGCFYALPQSPQLFKQLLMVAGFDRYYQIVKCFRDEDLRSDRQPEFTQIDVEMAFVERDDILNIIEGMIVLIWKEILGIELKLPFQRMAYGEAMRRFGSDKPDLRFGMELADIGDLAAKCEFQVFRGAAEGGGRVACINVKGGGERFSRKDIDLFTKFVADFGAKGLAWFKVEADGLKSSIAKFFPEETLRAIGARASAEPGDLLLFVADRAKVVADSLGALRVHVAEKLGLRDPKTFRFLWIVDAPLFEKDAETGKITYVHHPFTSPKPEYLARLESAPLEVIADAYDLVLNGVEIGGGSIRIHDEKVQRQVFRMLGIPDEESEKKFGFLLTGLRHGAPPHGGIAFGLDRLMMILCGEDSIRDVIAFPKTQRGVCLFTGAPSEVAPEQLREVGIRIQPPK